MFTTQFKVTIALLFFILIVGTLLLAQTIQQKEIRGLQTAVNNLYVTPTVAPTATPTPTATPSARPVFKPLQKSVASPTATPVK